MIEDNNEFNGFLKKLGEDNIEEAVIEEVSSQEIQEEPTVEKLALNCEKASHSSQEKEDTQDEQCGDRVKTAPPLKRVCFTDHIDEPRYLRSSGSVSTAETEKEVEEPDDAVVAQELAEICNTIRFKDDYANASNSS